MRFVFLLVNVLVFSIGAFGQEHYYYTPNTAHIPVLTDKNDGSACVGMSWESDYFALEVQGVYSPLKHSAIMLNYFDTRGNDVRKNEETGTSFRFLELGFGAYHALERGSASIFAGVGQGDLYNYYGSENFSQFTLRRYFVQPAVAYSDHYFLCGLALRLSYLTYPDGETSFDIDENELASIRKIEEESPFFLPELGFSGGIKFPPFVFSVNLTSVFPDAAGLNFARFNSNFMLTLDFGELKKMKPAKK
jgi:hypothetical protein